MKISIGATGVKALMEQDKEAFAELGKTAIQQVATEMTSRLRSNYIVDQVNAVINDKILGNNGRSSLYQSMNPAIQKAINAEMKGLAKEYIQKLEDKAFTKSMEEIAKSIFVKYEDEFINKMTLAADEIIRQRFSALFAAKD